MRNIDKIIVHCSASPEGKSFSVADIRRWHKQRGFFDIGYHYVIYLDGSVNVGRPLAKAGAHCKGQNVHSIGVCYIGGLAANGKTPKDTRTPEQKASLVKLITELQQQFPNTSVHGHREFANKACPCFNAKDEYKDL